VKLFLALVIAVTFLFGKCVTAQMPSEWHDDVVERMAGEWKVEGQVMGRDAHHLVEAEWVLNHQFLRLHERTATDAPAAERRYEAVWFLGYDPVSERYVLHLMDVFGARFSETLGYGTREGNHILFTFEYPDGSFHTNFVWHPEKNAWEWMMEQKGKDGRWSQFADLNLTKSASR
jgi:Protein of unknown function (DUF1579)